MTLQKTKLTEMQLLYFFDNLADEVESSTANLVKTNEEIDFPKEQQSHIPESEKEIQEKRQLILKILSLLG